MYHLESLPMELDDADLLGGFSTLSGYDVVGQHHPVGDGAPSPPVMDVFSMVNGFEDGNVGLHAASFGSFHDFFHGCDSQLFRVEGISGAGKPEPGSYGITSYCGVLSVSMEDSILSHSQVLDAVSTMQDTCVAVDDGLVAVDDKDDDVMKYINTDSTELDFTESVFSAPVVFQAVPSSPVDIPGPGYDTGIPGQPADDDDGRENVVEMLNELCDSLDGDLINNHAQHFMTSGDGSPLFDDFDLPPMSPDDVDSLLSSSPPPIPDPEPLPTVLPSLPVTTEVPISAPVGVATGLLTFAVLPTDGVVPVSPASSSPGCPSPPRVSTINLRDFLTTSGGSPEFQSASPPPASQNLVQSSASKPTLLTLSPVSSPLTRSILSGSSLSSTQFAAGTSPSPPVTEKRQRKKEQNKTAALRYRVKKRDEHGSVMSEYDQLERRNVELRTKVAEMTKEVDYLKGLIEEICA